MITQPRLTCNQCAFVFVCIRAVTAHAIYGTLGRSNDLVKLKIQPRTKCGCVSEMEGGRGLTQNVWRHSLLGEYVALAIVAHSTVCSLVWFFAAFQEPVTFGLSLGCIWIVLRTAELVEGNLGTLFLSLVLAGIAGALCYRGPLLLPNVGLLVAVQPAVCLTMLLYVVVLDVFEWRRNGSTK